MPVCSITLKLKTLQITPLMPRDDLQATLTDSEEYRSEITLWGLSSKVSSLCMCVRMVNRMARVLGKRDSVSRSHLVCSRSPAFWIVMGSCTST